MSKKSKFYICDIWQIETSEDLIKAIKKYNAKIKKGVNENKNRP